MEITRISNACFQLTLQAFLNPVYISHHFHGSVKYKRKGSHDKKSVIPAEKAYTLKTIAKEVRFPRIMTIAVYPRHDAIKIIPEAFTK